MIKMKVKKNAILYVWSLFLAISIVVRCLPTIIYPIAGLEYLIIMIISLMSVLFFIRNLNLKNIKVCDIFWIIIPFFFIGGNGNVKYIYFTIIALLFYFIIQKNIGAISTIRYPLVFFAITTSLVTWISFYLPSYYINHILTMFPEGTSLTYSFVNRNMYHGFTNHFSRNSFYITAGILLIFCDLLSKKKKSNKLSIVLLIFFFCTEFLVAKRGLTLFLLLTMFIIVFLKEPSFAKKIKKSFKFILLGIILFIFAYFLIPGVDNIVARIFVPNRADDISSGRFYLYGIAISMFLNKPILGNGWGSYLQAMVGTTYQGAHNDYLQLLCEVGIIGFIVFMIANFSSLYYTYKSFKAIRQKIYNGTKEQKWLLFSFSYQIFFLLYSLTGLPHYSYEQYTLYIMMCGIGIGMYKFGPEIGEN